MITKSPEATANLGARNLLGWVLGSTVVITVLVFGVDASLRGPLSRWLKDVKRQATSSSRPAFIPDPTDDIIRGRILDPEGKPLPIMKGTLSFLSKDSPDLPRPAIWFDAQLTPNGDFFAVSPRALSDIAEALHIWTHRSDIRHGKTWPAIARIELVNESGTIAYRAQRQVALRFSGFGLHLGDFVARPLPMILAGTLSDESGRPLVDRLLRVTSQPDAEATTTVQDPIHLTIRTDQEGRFRLFDFDRKRNAMTTETDMRYEVSLPEAPSVRLTATRGDLDLALEVGR